jgi:flagellar biosynthesis protein FlhF
MAYFTEQALTSTECLQKIRSKYGDHYKVLIHRTVRKGGLFGIGGHEEVEMTGTYGYGGEYQNPMQPRPSPEPRPFDLEREKQKLLAAAGKSAEAAGRPDPALQVLLKEVRSLNEKMDAKISAASQGPDHPSLKRLEDDLALNDFSPGYAKKMLDRVRREFPLEELDDYEAVQRRVVEWIGESISIYQEPVQAEPVNAGDEPGTRGRRKPRLIVLVGPTGVGKTTTLAKMAALFGELSGGVWRKAVRLVTLDNYRIGGKQQIEKYGEIMEIPVSSVENHDGLRSVLALYRKDVDFILVDTIGKSPRNYGELGDMKTVLDACGSRAEPHLCISASTKVSDIEEILRQFEPFKYKSVIITKLDETGRVGNVISALAEAGKSVSFITDGQTVPSDIAEAQVIRFLINLEGFFIDRDALARRFPETPKNTAQKTSKL